MNDFFVVPVSDESKAAARRDAAHAMALEVAAFLGWAKFAQGRPVTVEGLPISGLKAALAKFRGEGGGS